MSAIAGRAVGMQICGPCGGANCLGLCREAARRGGPSPLWLSTVHPAPFLAVIEDESFRQLSQAFFETQKGKQTKHQ